MSEQLSPAEPKEFSIALTLPPGNNIITLSTPEDALATDNPTADARKLSFAVYNVSLEASP
jgi:hypothetical protein